jgi:hypothetical protein
MTNYSIDDLTVLKEDSDSSPKSFTPLFEVPGKLYDQSYPKRLKHTFPDSSHWRQKVKFDGEEVVKWKKRIFERYMDV